MPQHRPDRRRVLVLVTAGTLGACRVRAQAQAAPMRVVTGFAPGGASDTIARVVAEGLQRALERTVLVEPRPGADGTLAALAVAAARPDGATLLLGSSSALVAAPALRTPPPYDPFAAFAPVCGLGRFTLTLLVHAVVPARTPDELLQLAERRPGALAAASSNSTAELALRQLLGARRVVHVPYRGDVPALADLVAGHVQLMVATGSNAAPFLADGRVRALASTAPGGGLALDVTPWLGLFAPAGLATERRTALAQAVAAGLADASAQARLASQGFEPEVLAPPAFEAYFRVQYARFVAAARRHGLTLER